MQRRLEQRELEDEYLVDERDAVEGEVSDSDKEFDAIIEVDQLIKELNQVHEANIRDEESMRNYYERMVVIMRKMHDIVDLLEFENEDLWRLFDEVIAFELFDFTNQSHLVEMAKLGYEMELPYKSFWTALVNIALLKHQEFPFFNENGNESFNP